MASRAGKSVGVVLLALVLGGALFAGSALAAPAPTPWSSIQVRLIDSKAGTPVTAVYGQLPTGTPLPAVGLLSVPTGVKVHWAGEMLGGPASEDPTTTYVITPKTGYDEVAIDMTRVPRAQIEYDDPTALNTKGQITNASLRWTCPVDTPYVSMSVLIPPNATVTASGSAAVESSGSTKYMTRVISPVKAGQLLALDVSYTTPVNNASTAAAPPAAEQQGRSLNGVLPFVVAAIVIGGIVYLIYRRQQSEPVPGYEPPSGEPMPEDTTPAQPASEPAEPPADSGDSGPAE